MSNSLWQIAFGPYALTVDRRTLRFDLRDTKAGIVWAESLPLGWIELQNEATGETSRHDFGDCKIISVSEKAGAQGKRILFGLDAPGPIPIDVYVICTEREIQLTVEASRDGKTHRVTGFGLVPGLVSVPDDGASYLVLPSGEGSGILARDVPNEETLTERSIPIASFRYPIWQAKGVYMPFVGAVRAKTGAENVSDAPAGSLGLITDSAYGAFVLSRHNDGGASLDTEYERDPERRRLDVRIVVLPGENHVGIARAYRDKIIGEKNHATLRRKIRERPAVDSIIGAAWYLDLYVKGMPSFKPSAEAVWGDCAQSIAVVALQTPENPPVSLSETANEAIALEIPVSLPSDEGSRWDTIETSLERINEAQKEPVAVGLQWAGDWAAIASDFVRFLPPLKNRSFLLPLTSVVYHDSLVMPAPLVAPNKSPEDTFLLALLRLSTAIFRRWTYAKPIAIPEEKQIADTQWRAPRYLVLCSLHRLTFTAFLTEHRFLTPDALVEEAFYSDKTRIVINRSEMSAYETPELHLSPGGFWVRHAQMEAHDALRVGEQIFGARAFRIRRALDGKPLEQSRDIETREFSV